MVKAKFGQHWRGNYYAKDELIPTNERQSKALIEAGLGYEVVEEKGISEKSTKAEIMAYLDADGIDYSPELTKAQLLELCYPLD